MFKKGLIMEFHNTLGLVGNVHLERSIQIFIKFSVTLSLSKCLSKHLSDLMKTILDEASVYCYVLMMLVNRKSNSDMIS